MSFAGRWGWMWQVAGSALRAHGLRWGSQAKHRGSGSDWARTRGGPGPSAGRLPPSPRSRLWMGGGRRRLPTAQLRLRFGQERGELQQGLFVLPVISRKGILRKRFAPRNSFPPILILVRGEACLLGRREMGSSGRAAGGCLLPFAAGSATGPRLRVRPRDREAEPPRPGQERARCL